MEGVGARLGRSSTRYGPATVFSGPVRKWKKKWVPLSSPSTNNAASHPNSNGNNNGSHLLLYKWTPISSQTNGVGAASSPASGKDTAAPATTPEEPPQRKFRYIPVYVLEEQKQAAAAAAAKSDDENKPNDADPSPRPTQSDGSDVKPDMNDVTMEEAQGSDKDPAPADESNETNLDLSLGLKAHDGDSGTDPKMVEPGESGNPGEDLETRSSVSSEAENRTKRKDNTPDLEMRV